MISIKNNFFKLDTEKTTYLFSATESGLLVHHYYGKRVPFHDYNNIMLKQEGGMGTAIEYEGNRFEYVDNMELEFSSFGIGDYRELPLSIQNQIHGYSNNFKYRNYQIIDDNDSFMRSYNQNQTLKVDLYDSTLNIGIELYYRIFEKANVITRYVKFYNNSNLTFNIERLFSMQLDLNDANYVMMTFDGAWAKERHLNEKLLNCGIYINDSKSGASSNKHNPLVIIRKPNTDEINGVCYGFNLVYSGNHKTTIEATPNQKLRILQGINDYAFNFEIKSGEEFITPEAVMSYSDEGLNNLSHNFHYFVNHHIVRGEFKNKVRPILINSWEATYFNFTEKKLLDLAKSAKEVGIELFVLDDGWFGLRNDDTSSLGDWDVNKKKLPNGLNGHANKINKLGLDFGLWVEPEMINEESELYKRHPDWAVKINGRMPGIGRNQLVLDLSNLDVRTYLIEKMTEVFSSCNLQYVKWDYNRNITDMFGSTLKNQGEFLHRYILGFYEVINELNKRFPHILFEGCASGGNRFDLGMLCFFPQIWTSDNTDYLERIYIQSGTSYGYPPSCISNHVSAVPNHQTLRNTPLASRFNLASFGVLGYELNLSELNSEELNEVKDQISFYKKYRSTLQYGKFYRSENSIFSSNRTYFYAISETKEQAILGFFQALIHPALNEDIIYVDGLENDLYVFRNKMQKLNLKMFGGLINYVSPIKLKVNGKLHNLVCKFYHPKGENERYLIYGDALKYAGIRLTQQFMGTGFSDKVRVLGDFGSRIYIIKKYNEKYKLNHKKIS